VGNGGKNIISKKLFFVAGGTVSWVYVDGAMIGDPVFAPSVPFQALQEGFSRLRGEQTFCDTYADLR